MKDEEETIAALIKELKELRSHVDELTLAEYQHDREKDELSAACYFLQSVIDGVTEPIMVIGVDYVVKYMNQAAREFYSAEPNDHRPVFCYRISHQQESPCNGIEHPCPLEQVRTGGQPVTVVHKHFNMHDEPRYLEIIAAPLTTEDGIFQGVIECMRDITERRQAEESLQRYTERLRALTAQLTEVAEIERQQLARELHDQVGQNLSALGINLNIARAQLPEALSAEVGSRLDDSLLLIEQTTERIRNVMADLRPPVLDDYGLVAALRWYGEQYSRRTDVAVTLKGEEPDPRLNTHVESAMFRIAQEVLTNAAKHAQASQVTVVVEIDRDSLRMVITDDGIGFTAQSAGEPEKDHGWGLLTIKERAEAIGGSCHVESFPNHGTQVSVEVPR